MIMELHNKVLDQFYKALIDGDKETFLHLFYEDVYINDPLFKDTGNHNLSAFFNNYHNWLKERVARYQKLNFWQDSEDTDKSAYELILHLNYNEKSIKLPVLLIADVNAEKVRSLHIYHSTWPLKGEHTLRKPFLDSRNVVLPHPVKLYQNYLIEGKTEEIVNIFDQEKGYVREPSGGISKGTGQLKVLYKGFFDIGNGGLKLQHCSKIDNGNLTALEFNIEKAGNINITPQAGCAVYEYDKISGKIISARIYDDFDPKL